MVALRDLDLDGRGFDPCGATAPLRRRVAKSQAMADFGDEEYLNMLRIEPAVALSGPETLQTGGTWSVRQVLVCS